MDKLAKIGLKPRSRSSVNLTIEPSLGLLRQVADGRRRVRGSLLQVQRPLRVRVAASHCQLGLDARRRAQDPRGVPRDARDPAGPGDHFRAQVSLDFFITFEVMENIDESNVNRCIGLFSPPVYDVLLPLQSFAWVGRTEHKQEAKLAQRRHSVCKLAPYPNSCPSRVLPDFPITMRLRNHYLLEPPSKAGAPEKLFRYFEEINGNKLLNERRVAKKCTRSIV